MKEGYIWLILIELAIIGLVFIIRYILKKIEERKVNKILKFIDKKSKESKETEAKFKECLEIVKQNNSKVEKK
jgi:hypothetical protein